MIAACRAGILSAVRGTAGAAEESGQLPDSGVQCFDDTLLREALSLAAARGLPRYETLQNEYNLYTRSKFEGPVQDLVRKEGLSGLAYFSLASGFLTGKYRSEADFGKSPRGGAMSKYLDDKGRRILAAQDTVSARTGASLAEIALAWVNAQRGIAAPIASATSIEQLGSLARGARLTLSPNDVALLTDAGAA